MIFKPNVGARGTPTRVVFNVMIVEGPNPVVSHIQLVHGPYMKPEVSCRVLLLLLPFRESGIAPVLKFGLAVENVS